MKKISFYFQAVSKALCGIILLSSAALAYERGETAFNFLKIGSGPRAVGMGEAFASVADDSTAVYWNPAGLAGLNRYEISLNQYRWVEKITYQNLNLAYPLNKHGSLGFAVYQLGKNDIQGYDAGGSATQKLKFADTAFALSYAYPVKMFNSSVGITAKHIEENIAGEKASAVAFDAGLLGVFSTPLTPSLNAGIVLKNMGSKVKFDKESFPMPFSITAGGSSRFMRDALLLSADYTYVADNNAFFAIGTEFNPFEYVFLRAGYRSQFSSNGDLADGFRCGIGAGSRDLSVDYAFAPMGVLGDTHRFGISARFGHNYRRDEYSKRVERHFRKAQNFYRAGRLVAAEIEVASVLRLNPAHMEAAGLRQKIHEEIDSENILIYLENAKNLLDRNRLIESERLCNKILELKPGQPEALALAESIKERLAQEKNKRIEILFEQGEEFFGKEAYKDAIDLWEKIQIIDEQNSMVSKRIEEARKMQLSRQEEKNRLYADFLYKEAESSYNKKRYEKAAELLNEILGKYPSHEKASSLRKLTEEHLLKNQTALSDKLLKEGIIRLENKNIEQAVLLFKDALEAYPRNEQAAEYLRKTSTMLDESNKAKAAECNKNGLAAYSQGKIKKAIEHFQEALKLYPEYEEAQKNLTRARRELQR